MNETRRSNYARIAPMLGATLALLWLTSSTPSGASLSWPEPFPIERWFAAEPLAAHDPALAPSDPAPEAAVNPLAVAALPADPLAHRPFGAEIRAAAGRHEVDPLLVAAIVEVESNFAPDAVSAKGAIGLMQLMPVHFEAAERPFEPTANLELGTRYLGELSRRFGALPIALAAYHAGPGAVERAGLEAPYGSTRRYVERVLSVYGRYRSEAGGTDSIRANAAVESGAGAL
jgi:soluble lytic murein transglycosylase-like protein